MRTKLHQIECNREELLDLPDAWIPVRFEHNEYQTPLRKAYALHRLERV